MVTRVGTQDKAVDALIALLELEFDALAAYKAAVKRIETQGYLAKLEEFKRDHERHIEEIGPEIKALGATAPTEGDFKAYLTKGKVIAGELAGDKGILIAMKTNEDDTNTAYENMTNRKDLPQGCMKIMKTCLQDERRHRAWIEETIEG